MAIEPRYGFSQSIDNENFQAELFLDQHNQRLKIVNYAGNPDILAERMIELSREYGFGKIVVVADDKDRRCFLNKGYNFEGAIEGFFKGEKGHCLSYFTKKDRAVSLYLEQENDIIDRAQEVKGQYNYLDNKGFLFRDAEESDAPQLAELYDNVFKSYPTPMDNPDYIKKVMNQKVLFKVAEFAGQIISTASADMNMPLLNAEITDCATLAGHRGKGLLSDLIYMLEEKLKTKGFITLFSLSRALSVGVNIVFSKHDYVYTGRLLNNCEIMGKFEDMNIWVKKLKQ